MPGATPTEAVRAFVEPLQSALGCVARGKITVSPNGYDRMGVTHSWSINGGDGAPVGKGLNLFGGMQYRIITEDEEGYGPFRVTTEGYMYALERDERELFALHWHPSGVSNVTGPHLHLGDPILTAESPINSKAHLPTARMTFEQAIRWAIEFGTPPLCADWEQRLALAEGAHLIFRSWSQDPNVRNR